VQSNIVGWEHAIEFLLQYLEGRATPRLVAGTDALDDCTDVSVTEVLVQPSWQVLHSNLPLGAFLILVGARQRPWLGNKLGESIHHNK
jgi:hypothetical protein